MSIILRDKLSSVLGCKPKRSRCTREHKGEHFLKKDVLRALRKKSVLSALGNGP